MSESLPKTEDRLAELLLTWEDSVAAGSPVSIDVLCRDCPELVPDIERQICRLKAINDYLYPGSSDSINGSNCSTIHFCGIPRFPTLPGYEILEEIGKGGMGVVYKARQLSLGRLVAVKTLAGSRWGQPGFVARLRHEAQALSRLKDRHVVQVIDVVETEHAVSIVLEYVEGGTLAKRQNGAPLPVTEASQLALTLAETLARVHTEGLLHRDIKPANVLINVAGEIKMTDFGLAKEAGATDGLTVTGDVLGSPGYMAPEQALGRTSAIDVRTDVYALGATLYEMLTGRPPFVGGSVVETLDQVRDHDPVAIRLLNPRVPLDLETICLKCLEKEPARRFATALSLADELKRYLRGEPIQSRPIGTFDRCRRWCRRRPAWAAFIGLSAAAALVIVALLAVHQRDLSEYNRNLAQKNDDLEQAAADALELQRIAQENERKTKDMLYAGDMNRAAAAWRDEDTRGMMNLLERYVPQPGERDRRGFEWWYLYHQARLSHKELFNVASPIYFVAPSTDERLFAVAGRDAIARLIDAETGAVVREIVTGQIEVNGVAFAPDRNELATSGDDGTIRIWDLETGIQRLKFQAHPGKAYQLHYTTDGGQIVSCGDNPIICIFDAKTGEKRKTLDGHSGDVQSLILANDGRTLVSTSSDHTARIWDLDGGKLGTTVTSSRRVGTVALSQNRKLMIIGNDEGLLQTVDIGANREIGVVKHFDRIGALALHPGGELIAAADGSGKIRLRKINAAGEFIKDHFQPWQAHQGHIYCLAWSADGSHLHSAGVDGRLIRWSLEAAMHQSGPDRICLEGADSFTLIPETTSLVTSGRSLVKWNWVTGQAEASFQDAKGFHDVTISPDGKLIAAIDDSRAAKVFVADEIFRAPPNAARCLFDWNPGGWVGSIHFSPDSKSLAVRFQPAGTDGQPDARRVWLHGPPNYQTAEQVPVPGAKAVAFASNGQRLALLRDAGLVLWNISPRTLHWEKAQSDSSVVVFSPNGKLLASGGGNRVVIVRTADDGIVRHQLVGHRDNINALAFSPDNATLAAASLDGVIKLWHVPTGQEMFELRGTGGVCHRVEFTGDGRNFLALVDADPGLDEILVYRAGESEADE